MMGRIMTFAAGIACGLVLSIFLAEKVHSGTEVRLEKKNALLIEKFSKVNIFSKKDDAGVSLVNRRDHTVKITFFEQSQGQRIEDVHVLKPEESFRFIGMRTTLSIPAYLVEDVDGGHIAFVK